MNCSIYTENNSISHDRTFSISFGMIHRCFVLISAIFILSFYPPEICTSVEKTEIIQTEKSTGLKITKAVICEEIKDGQTINEGVIFSSDLGKITCYSEFDSITEKTTIYHCWYFKDNLRAKKKPLVLYPPKWSTFSQIEPRETDKGPWRVEITDQDGNILQTLRFSITD